MKKQRIKQHKYDICAVFGKKYAFLCKKCTNVIYNLSLLFDEINCLIIYPVLVSFLLKDRYNNR